MKNGKRIFLATIALMLFVMTAGTATASDEPIDYWDLYYVANAPASVNHQSQALTVRKSLTNYYAAEATTLTGSSDRYVRIFGRNDFVINNTNHYITITAPNVLTSSFYATGSTAAAFFRASANGSSTCTSIGYVRIVDSTYP